MQVAQAALAVLDVGLDAIARLAGPPVALVALGQLRLDELLGGALHDLPLEAPHQVLEQRLVAKDQRESRSAVRMVMSARASFSD